MFPVRFCVRVHRCSPGIANKLTTLKCVIHQLCLRRVDIILDFLTVVVWYLWCMDVLDVFHWCVSRISYSCIYALNKCRLFHDDSCTDIRLNHQGSFWILWGTMKVITFFFCYALPPAFQYPKVIPVWCRYPSCAEWNMCLTTLLLRRLFIKTSVLK